MLPRSKLKLIAFLLGAVSITQGQFQRFSASGSIGFATSQWFSSSTLGREQDFSVADSLLIFDNQPVSVRWRLSADASKLVYGDDCGVHKTAGFGASPAGVEVEFSKWRVRPVVMASGGFLYFDQPLFGETKFNFTAQFGGGLRIPLGGKFGVEAGYRHHHISNANLGMQNPGMDNHTVYFAVTASK